MIGFYSITYRDEYSSIQTSFTDNPFKGLKCKVVGNVQIIGETRSTHPTEWTKTKGEYITEANKAKMITTDNKLIILVDTS